MNFKVFMCCVADRSKIHYDIVDLVVADSNRMPTGFLRDAYGILVGFL